MTAAVTPWVTAASLAGDPRLDGVALPPSITLSDVCSDATDLLYRWSGCRFSNLDASLAPPAAGIRAARELALNLALEMSGKPSRLPNRATVVARQGVTIDRAQTSALSSTAGWLVNGYIGIPVIDYFLRAVNPDQLTEPPAVFDPNVECAVTAAGDPCNTCPPARTGYGPPLMYTSY